MKDKDLFILIIIIIIMTVASGRYLKINNYGQINTTNSNSDNSKNYSVGYSNTGYETQNSNGVKFTDSPPIKADVEEKIRETAIKIKQLQADLAQLQKENLDKAQASVYKGMVQIWNVYTDKNPENEYLVMQANYGNSKKILVSGWTLKGTTPGATATIGNGAYLYYYGITTDSLEPIYLAPGEKVIVGTGRSPLGINFRLNKCSGYLDQYRNFIPSLRHDCPYPKDEEDIPIPKNETLYNGYNLACWDTINSLPACRSVANLDTLSKNKRTYNQQCIDYLATINMNACINTHYLDSDFYENEWRVYLGRSVRMWKDRDPDYKIKAETVKLLDDRGKVVDSYQY